MATPKLDLAAEVDVVLKGGNIDESKLLKALTSRLQKVRTPEILIDAQYRHDGKPISKRELLTEVTATKKIIDQKIKKLGEEIATPGLGGSQRATKKAQQERLAGLRNYLYAVENSYREFGAKIRRFSDQTKQDYEALLTGKIKGADLAQDKKRLENVRAMSSEVSRQTDLVRQLQRQINQLNQKPIKALVGMRKGDKAKKEKDAPIYADIRPERVASADLQRLTTDLQKGSALVERMISREGLGKSMEQASKELKKKEDERIKASTSKLNQQVKEYEDAEKQKTATSNREWKERTQDAAKAARRMRQLIFTDQDMKNLADPNARQRIMSQMALGQAQLRRELDELIDYQKRYLNEAKRTGTYEQKHYDRLTDQIRTLRGEMDAFNDARTKIQRKAAGQTEEARKKKVITDTAAAEIDYGREALAKAGKLTKVAKADLPYVVRYMEQMRKETAETAKRMLLLHGASSKAFGKAKTEAHQAALAFEEANRRLKGTGKLMSQMNALGVQFLRYGIGYSALYQVLFGARELVSSVVNLQGELKNIQAITNATAKDMLAIEASVKRTAITTKFNTTEIAEAARLLAQAGVTPKEFNSTLNAVAQFATATGSTIEIASDLLTTMRTVFKELDDTQIANQLTRALNISKLTAADLKTILSLSAQMAENYNLSSEQYLAAVSTLRDAGLKASTAATGLRQGLIELFAPDQKTIKILSQRYAQLGEALTQAQIRNKFFQFTQSANPLIEVLRELRRLGFNDRGAATFQRTFDVRAENAIKALINNFEDLEKAESKISFGNAAAKAATTQMEALNNSLKNLGAALSVLSYDLTRDLIPDIEDVVDALTEAVEAMTRFNTELEIAGRRGFGSFVGTGAVNAAVAATNTQGGFLARGAAAVGAFAGGTAIAGGTSQLGTALGLSPKVASVLETIAAFVTWIATAAIFKRGSAFIKAFKTGGAAAAFASGGKGLAALGGLFKKIGGFVTGAVASSKGLLKYVFKFGGLLRALLGPWGALLAVGTTIYQVSKQLLMTKEDELNQLKEQAKSAGEARESASRDVKEYEDYVDNYRLSTAGNPAKSNSTAAKFEAAQDQYLTALERVLVDLGIRNIEEFQRIAAELEKPGATQEGDEYRNVLLQELQGLTKRDILKGRGKALLDELLSSYGTAQSLLAGFVESQREEIDALERSEERTPQEESLLRAYREIRDKLNLYDKLEGNLEIASDEVIGFFNDFLRLFVRLAEDTEEYRDIVNTEVERINEETRAQLQVVKESLGENLQIAIEDLLANLDELSPQEQTERIDELLAAVAAERVKEEGRRSLSLFGPATVPEDAKTAIAGLKKAEDDLLKARELAQKKILELNREMLAEAERLLRNTRALVERSKSVGYLGDILTDLPAPAKRFIDLATDPNTKPEDLLETIPGTGGRKGLKPDVKKGKRATEQVVRTYPEPATIPEDVQLDIERRKRIDLLKVEQQELEENRKFNEAQKTLRMRYQEEEAQRKERIDQIKKLIEVPDPRYNKSEVELREELSDLEVAQRREASDFHREMRGLQRKSLEAANKSIKEEIENLKKYYKERGKQGGHYIYPGRGEKYRGLIESAAGAHGISSDLLAALIETESNFNPRALSPKGAAGLAQFMPATGRRYGLSEADRYDPAKAIYAAANYLADLLRMFGGNTALALAGYNAGENAVKKYGGIPPYPETQKYVAKVGAKFAGASPELESRFQTLMDQYEVNLRKLAPLNNLSENEIQAQLASMRERGQTLADLAESDKALLKAQKSMLAYIEATNSANRVTGTTDLEAEIRRRSQGVEAPAKERLEEINARAVETRAQLERLFAIQQELTDRLAASQGENDAELMARLVEVEGLIQESVDSLAEFRKLAIATSMDVGAALADAFDISAIAASMREMAEEDIGNLATDIHDIIVGAFQDAGEEIADALFNPEAEGDISERLDKLFQKMFQEIASQIFTAYFNKLVAGAFTRLEGILGGGGGGGGIGGAAGAAVGGAVNASPMQDAVNATATAVKDTGVSAAKGSKGIFDSLFSGLGSILKSIFGGLKGLIGGIGGGIKSAFTGILSFFGAGFASGGMIRGIKGIDNIPGFAVGRAGKVSPIRVSSEESILNRDATAALGEPFINSLNRDPRKLLRGPQNLRRLAGTGPVDGPFQQAVENGAATLQSLEELQSVVSAAGGGATRIEVPADVLGLSMQSYLERYFDDVIATR